METIRFIDTPERRWLPVPGAPFFRVSDDGLVRRLEHVITRSNGTRQRMKKQLMRQHGRRSGLSVFIGSTISGTQRCAKVGRLVLEAFVGPAPSSRSLAIHEDGDWRNCRLSNLRWGDWGDWGAVRDREGTTAYGERHGAAKLTNERVLEIRAARRAGVALIDLAEEHGVSKSAVQQAAVGGTWKRVEGAVA